GHTATLSLYCDMSSFFYYKNLLMGANRVMLQEMADIKLYRCTGSGMSEEQALQLTQAIPYEENNRYNPAFAYNIFLLSIILFVMIQQTMFYGMSIINGTARERGQNLYRLPGRDGRSGVLRYVSGRGLAYLLVYLFLGLYISTIVPAIFGIVPQRGSFFGIAALTLLFVVDCVAFSMVWSSLSLRRESVFLLFLFLSPICVFLTGTSWPAFAMPRFWQLVSYILPSTFGCQAYLNMNTAGMGFEGASSQITAMIIQTAVYLLAAILIARFSGRKGHLPPKSGDDGAVQGLMSNA
ncbi:MAG: ABC transporter permease, partial [Bacteroidales bacterium]|nr:ABC transporter permease [Bacteroidales bacterium]